jgi:hypothetical protein
MPHTLADSAKTYLDYLDKEMTIQGILSAFCVGFGAAAFDRVLRVKDGTVSQLITNLQTNSLPFTLAAIIAMMVAALCFYLQRSELAWLHGQISLAVTRKMENISTPPDRYNFDEGLEIGDSWSLWNRYLFGLSFLSVAAANALIAVFLNKQKITAHCLLTSIAIAIIFLLAILYDVNIFFQREKRDQASAGARKIQIRNIRAAKTRRLSLVGRSR